MQTTKSLYSVLGLSRGASQDDIRTAHRKLVREHHPDINPGDATAEERFKEIQQAYEVLSNPEKRREYDQRFHASAARRSDKPRAGTGARTEQETVTTVDLSDILRKLADRSGRSQDGSRRLQDEEEVARLARVLGERISRISELLGKDVIRLSKVLGDNIKVGARVSVSDARSEKVSATGENSAGRRRSGRSGSGDRSPGGSKRVERTQRKGKKVQGPKARRERMGD
jgi:curved DNA-binding protein CbpA